MIRSNARPKGFKPRSTAGSHVILVLALAIGAGGCVSSHGDDTLTFDGRRYVLKVFLDDAQAARTPVEPIGEATQVDTTWVTDRTVYRVPQIDPGLVILVNVDPARWEPSEPGSVAPPMAAFANVASDLTQPEVSELLADALPSAPPDRLEALVAAETRWRSKAPGSYRLTVELTWLVPPEWRGPFTFFVRDGKVYEAYRGKEPLPLDDKTLLEVPQTVPALFAELHRLAAADELDVRFDATYGFPIEIRVDVAKEAIDGEGGWLVSGFEAFTSVP